MFLKVLKKEVLFKLNVGNYIDFVLVKIIDFIFYSLFILFFFFLGELMYKNQFLFDEDYVYQEFIDVRKIIEQVLIVFYYDFDEEVEMVLVQYLMNLIDKKLFIDDMVE